MRVLLEVYYRERLYRVRALRGGRGMRTEAEIRKFMETLKEKKGTAAFSFAAKQTYNIEIGVLTWVLEDDHQMIQGIKLNWEADDA